MVVLLLIIALTAGVYANSLQNEFTNWDDDALVVNNRAIRSLDFENIKKIFTYHTGNTYQPVRNFSYAIDYYIGQLDTKWYHIHNITLHIFATIFLYFALLVILPQLKGWEAFEKGAWHGSMAANHVAFITVLVFAVHPVNVESVTWLSSRKYVDLSFFAFLSFLLFVLSSADGVLNPFKHIKTFLLAAGSVFAAVLAVFSSPFGVFLPGLFFLFDYCREKSINPFRVIKKRFFHYIPYLCFVFFIFPMLWFALAGSFGGAAMAHYKGDVRYTLYSIFNVLFDYVRNMTIPLWLNNRYVDYIFLSPFDIYKIPVVFLALLLLAVLIVWQLRRKSKIDLFCLGWFFIAWLPASNIIPISTKMADRYIYIASIGFFLWLSLYFYRIIKKKKIYMIMGCIVLTLVLGSLSALTVHRNTVWKNSGTLWQDSLKKDPGNFLAHTNLGNYLFLTGKKDQAERHYKEALRNAPYDVKALDNLGMVYTMKGEYEKAELSYRKLLKFKPDNLEIDQKIGELMIKTGQLDKAEALFQEVIKHDPENYRVLNSLGNIKFKTKNFESALEYYKKALVLNADNPDVLFNKALVFASLSSSNRAASLYEKTLERLPGHLEALNNVGLYMENQGRLEKAIEYYEKAIVINPDFAEAHNNMGNALFADNKIDQARAEYKTALLLNPEYADTHYNMAVLLDKTGETQKALAEYESALKFDQNHVQALNNMGNLYLSLGNLEKSIALLTKATELKADFMEAHFNLAYALSAAGKIDQAGLHYEIAGKLNSSDPQVFYNLAVIRAAQGEFNQAVKHFEHVLLLDPENQQAQLDLGIALFKQKNYAKAEKYLSRVLDRDPKNTLAIKIIDSIQKNKGGK